MKSLTRRFFKASAFVLLALGSEMYAAEKKPVHRGNQSGSTLTVESWIAGPGINNAGDRLWEAAVYGRTDQVKRLIAEGADVHADGDAALCGAAEYGHTETVKALVAAGADVHAWNEEPLALAAMAGHTATIKALLAAGADVNAGDQRALKWAAQNRQTETVAILAEWARRGPKSVTPQSRLF